MESIVQNELEKIKEYLISIKNDYERDSWIIEIGIPAKWVISNNELIIVNIITELPEYKIVSINPNNPDVSIDVLLQFICLIIKTNMAIVEKQKQFALQIKEMEMMIKEQTMHFYEEIDDLGRSQVDIMTKFDSTAETPQLEVENQQPEIEKKHKLKKKVVDETIIKNEE